jgi:hypothetical protein
MPNAQLSHRFNDRSCAFSEQQITEGALFEFLPRRRQAEGLRAARPEGIPGGLGPDQVFADAGRLTAEIEALAQSQPHSWVRKASYSGSATEGPRYLAA